MFQNIFNRHELSLRLGYKYFHKLSLHIIFSPTLQSLIAAQAKINAQGEDCPILINTQNGISARCNFCWYISIINQKVQKLGSNWHEKRENRGENFGKIWEKSPKSEEKAQKSQI